MATAYCTAQDVDDCCAWPRFALLAATAQTRLIAAASKRVDKLCRRPFGFAAASITETFDGRNLPSLFLSLRPVITVSAITLNGDPLDNTYGTSWNVNQLTGRLCRGDGQDATRFQPWFPAGQQNVAVQYWGGYQPLPDEIVAATAFYVKYLYEQGKVSGIYSSESIGDYSYSLRDGALAGTAPAHILAILGDYIQDDAF